MEQFLLSLLIALLHYIILYGIFKLLRGWNEYTKGLTNAYAIAIFLINMGWLTPWIK